MKTQVMVLERFGEPLVQRDVDVPALSLGQVLVRIDAAGVCGSDVHITKGEDPRIPVPIIPGHEGVGTVVDVNGSRETVDGLTVKPGDRIIWNRGMSCGHCWYCAALKEPSQCIRRKVFGINIPFDAPPFLNGCYARHIILRDTTDMFILPGTADPATLVAASCSGATIAHAFDMLRGSLIGKTVVVQGPGPLGVFAVAFAQALGASEIAVIGGTRTRLDLCHKFGANTILDRHILTKDERREVVLDLTAGRGADVVVEAVGTAGVAEEGVGLLRRGGVLLATGYAQPAGTDEIDFYRDVVAKNVEIRGVWVSDTSHLRQAVDLVLSRQQLFSRLVTHRVALDDADTALKLMESRTALKAVLIND